MTISFGIDNNTDCHVIVERWDEKNHIHIFGTRTEKLSSSAAEDMTHIIHAHWIVHIDENGITNECSNCHHLEGMLDGNYCPNCGAKMDE